MSSHIIYAFRHLELKGTKAQKFRVLCFLFPSHKCEVKRLIDIYCND